MAKDLGKMLERAKKALGIVIKKGTGENLPSYIPEDTKKDEVSDYIQSLKKDSIAWRKRSLSKRFRQYWDPISFWRDARKLESGNHWEVWGPRKDKKRPWRSEHVEDEISNQIRAKVAYITANWHDLEIQPNVNNIDKIINQERKKTEWGETIREGLKQGKIEGTAMFQSIIDTEKIPEGLAREIVLENESLLPSPYSKSLARRDGCWYLGVATVQTLQEVLAEWDVDQNKLSFISAQDTAELTGSAGVEGDKDATDYSKTKFVESLVFNLDDPAVEIAPFDRQETDQEHATISQGGHVKVYEGDNHEEHIKHHIDFLDEIWEAYEMTPPTEEEAEEAEMQMAMITEAVVLHIEEHTEMVELVGLASNQRYKYPYGRYIVVKGGQVVADEPNPMNIPWRNQFTMYVNEKVPHQFWGRGEVEILWNRNFIMDDMLSKFADSAFLNSMNKEYRHIDDKEILEQEDYSDEPDRPGFYDVSPPDFRKAGSVPPFLEVYSIQRDSAARSGGISEVTYGRAPHARASGEMTQMLIQQSAVLVTGEANTNLSAVVEKLIETRLMLYREFYTQPRYYYLNNRMTLITVADILKFQPVFNEQGEQIGVEEVDLFEVHVEPKSNFPSRWDALLQLVVQMATTPDVTGMPFLPREAVLDVLADQHPDFAVGGKYYQISQALAMGIQAMQEVQAEEERNEAVQNQVENRLVQRGIESLMSNEHGGE